MSWLRRLFLRLLEQPPSWEDALRDMRIDKAKRCGCPDCEGYLKEQQ